MNSNANQIQRSDKLCAVEFGTSTRSAQDRDSEEIGHKSMEIRLLKKRQDGGNDKNSRDNPTAGAGETNDHRCARGCQIQRRSISESRR